MSLRFCPCQYGPSQRRGRILPEMKCEYLHWDGLLGAQQCLSMAPRVHSLPAQEMKRGLSLFAMSLRRRLLSLRSWIFIAISFQTGLYHFAISGRLENETDMLHLHVVSALGSSQEYFGSLETRVWHCYCESRTDAACQIQVTGRSLACFIGKIFEIYRTIP